MHYDSLLISGYCSNCSSIAVGLFRIVSTKSTDVCGFLSDYANV